MSSLSDVVRALADRPGVEAVVVASMDGLPIAHDGSGRRPTLMPWRRWRRRRSATSSRLADGSALGEVQTIALEGDQGTLLLTPAAPGSWLLVAGRAGREFRPGALRPPPASHRARDAPVNWGVILAGGSGTRFWPLSTPSQPKQLLPLTGPGSTAEAAVERLEGFIPRERDPGGDGPCPGGAAAGAAGPARRPTSWSSPGRRPPRRRCVWATLEARRRDPEAEVLSMHADWGIGEPEAFRQTADLALRTRAARTTGWSPSAWCRRARRRATATSCRARRSTRRHAGGAVRQEKPDAATALDLMAAGALWNSGLFAWTAERLRAEVKAPHAGTGAVARPRSRPATWRGSSRGSLRSPSTSACWSGATRWRWCAGAFRWDDVGTWDALGRIRERDARGNVHGGPGVAARRERLHRVER